MRVELAKLKPNPHRNFDDDPIDQEALNEVAASIHENGFWGGCSLSPGKNGDLEIDCGMTRVAAAIKEGITHADLHVTKRTDAKKILAYASENLTQRGELGTAAYGVISSATRFLIKGILKGDEDVTQICVTSQKGLETIRGQIASEKGLGYECILRFLKKAQGLNENIVIHQLANLKASGRYAEIVKEVSEEIAREQAEERAELERREAEAQSAKEAAEAALARAREAKALADQKAAKEAEGKAEEAKQKQAAAQKRLEEKSEVQKTRDTSAKAVAVAAKRPITFDFNGVARFLKTEHQQRVFRQIVEREQVKKHIPLGAQSKLAALLVKYANQHNRGELTGAFMETYLTEMIKANLRKGGDLDFEVRPEAIQAIERENARLQEKKLQHHFCRQWLGLKKDMEDMIRLREQYPELSFPTSSETLLVIKIMAPTVERFLQAIPGRKQ